MIIINTGESYSQTPQLWSHLKQWNSVGDHSTVSCCEDTDPSITAPPAPQSVPPTLLLTQANSNPTPNLTLCLTGNEGLLCVTSEYKYVAGSGI